VIGESRALPFRAQSDYTAFMNKCIPLGVLAALVLFGCAREKLGPPPPGLHKRASLSISYFLDRGTSDALELGVRQSFQLWSDATMFKFVYGGRTAVRVARDGRNEIVLMTRWPNELPIGKAAWCQVYLDDAGQIAEADILLNAQAFSFTTAREAKLGSLYVEDVLAKAIGASLGIGLGENEEAPDAYRAAKDGEAFEPGIDPAEMASYLSIYEAGKSP
jgi:hypothetical protein